MFSYPSSKVKVQVSLIHSLFALFLMQRVAALVPGGVTVPPPAEIPVELRSYYASLTLEPSDILSFGYQIASGMVSEETTKLLVCVSQLMHQSPLPL